MFRSASIALRCLVASRRGFHSRAEHATWVRGVVSSRMLKPAQIAPAAQIRSPFLADVDPMIERLQLFACPKGAQQVGTPEASFLQATYPLSVDPILLRSVSDVNHHGPGGDEKWAGFRYYA